MNTSTATFRRLSLGAIAATALMVASSANAYPGTVIIVGGRGGGGGGGGGGPYGCDPTSQSCLDMQEGGTIFTDELATLDMQGVRGVSLTMKVVSDTGRVHEAQIADSYQCTVSYDANRRVDSVACDFGN